MAGKDNPRDQDPYPTTSWGREWDTENPFPSTDFTVSPNLPPERWW
ncbi:hypothetical protein [Halobiforma nitratireducens]|nr:hypothetical protein [Halobiforma nitratireducens]